MMRIDHQTFHFDKGSTIHHLVTVLDIGSPSPSPREIAQAIIDTFGCQCAHRGLLFIRGLDNSCCVEVTLLINRFFEGVYGNIEPDLYEIMIDGVGYWRKYHPTLQVSAESLRPYEKPDCKLELPPIG